MSELVIEHNLEGEELQKAIVSLARESGLVEDIVKSLKEEKAHVPRVPSHPATKELYRRFQALFGESVEWVEGYLNTFFTERLKKAEEDDELEKAEKPFEHALSKEEIRTIQEAIKDRFGFVAAQMESVDFEPSIEVLKRWKELGFIDKSVTPKAFAVAMSSEKKLVQNAFLFGRLYQAVEKGKSFDEVMKLALEMPLIKPDVHAIAVAEQQTANFITAFGDGLSKEFGQAASARNREIVRKMAIDYHGHELKREGGRLVDNWQGFSSELATKFQDHERDWDKIAFYELGDARRQGQGMELLETFGPDQLVYKMPLPTACEQCIHLYVNPDGTPKLFKLAEMLKHGNNIGRKPYPVSSGMVSSNSRVDGAETLKPVAGLVHPWCSCMGPYAYTGYESWAKKE